MSAPFEMFGTKGGRDQRLVLSITVPHWAPTLADVETVGKDGAPLGLAETGRTFGASEAGGFHVDVTYEGTQGEPNADNATFALESSFSEEPIESHPEIDSIKAKYGGFDGPDNTVQFPPKMPNADSTSGLGGTDAAPPNPMYNVKTYLVLRAVFRRTYAVKQFPSHLLGRVGSVSSQLPGGLPTPKDHDWLFMPPKVRNRGNVYEVEEELLMSRKGGWPKAVYALIEGAP